MTQIDSTTRLAAVIRRQVTSLARAEAGGSAAGGSRAGSRPSAGATCAAGSAAGPKDVAALVARRIQAIDPSDPDRRRKAFRVFLESVLLAELGGNLVNDAGFHRLVDDVHGEMDADEDLAAAIHDATTLMLAPTPPPRPA